MEVAEAATRLLQSLTGQLLAAGVPELLAVALGFAYVLLAIRQNRWCWVAGGLSTALYVTVFADARLYLQAALQVLYVLLAVYGWRAWYAPAGRTAPLRHWTLRRHLLAALCVAAATLLTGPALAAWSDAAAPWADALGTWASVAATWMLARKIVAAWLWWIVIDSGLATLFASQGLVFTAALYLAFAALGGVGWRAWQRAGTPASG